jgi:hypothetical protein
MEYLTRHHPGLPVIRAKKAGEEKPADAAKPAPATAATPAVVSPQKSAAPVAASALYQRTRPHTILSTPNLLCSLLNAWFVCLRSVHAHFSCSPSSCPGRRTRGHPCCSGACYPHPRGCLQIPPTRLRTYTAHDTQRTQRSLLTLHSFLLRRTPLVPANVPDSI